MLEFCIKIYDDTKGLTRSRKSENDRQWSKENKDKRIIHSNPQNHKHVFNKSKLKVVKIKMILQIKTQKI